MGQSQSIERVPFERCVSLSETRARERGPHHHAFCLSRSFSQAVIFAKTKKIFMGRSVCRIKKGYWVGLMCSIWMRLRSNNASSTCRTSTKQINMVEISHKLLPEQEAAIKLIRDRCLQPPNTPASSFDHQPANAILLTKQTPGAGSPTHAISAPANAKLHRRLNTGRRFFVIGLLVCTT